MKAIKNTKHSRKPRVYAPDRIGMVGFNDFGFVIAKPAEAHQPWLQERARRLHMHVKGVTNMTDGLMRGIDLLERTPKGIYRRIWLLSDGEPNKAEEMLTGVVQKASLSYININTIGFGDQYNERLLREIAEVTHNGRFVSVASLRELTNTLVGYGSDNGISKRRHRRSETTVLVIDLSTSMNEPMEGKTKVAVVEEAILHLLHYKQQLFS